MVEIIYATPELEASAKRFQTQSQLQNQGYNISTSQAKQVMLIQKEQERQKKKQEAQAAKEAALYGPKVDTTGKFIPTSVKKEKPTKTDLRIQEITGKEMFKPSYTYDASSRTLTSDTGKIYSGVTDPSWRPKYGGYEAPPRLRSETKPQKKELEVGTAEARIELGASPATDVISKTKTTGLEYSEVTGLPTTFADVRERIFGVPSPSTQFYQEVESQKQKLFQDYTGVQAGISAIEGGTYIFEELKSDTKNIDNYNKRVESFNTETASLSKEISKYNSKKVPTTEVGYQKYVAEGEQLNKKIEANKAKEVSLQTMYETQVKPSEERIKSYESQQKQEELKQQKIQDIIGKQEMLTEEFAALPVTDPRYVRIAQQKAAEKISGEQLFTTENTGFVQAAKDAFGASMQSFKNIVTGRYGEGQKKTTETTTVSPETIKKIVSGELSKTPVEQAEEYYIRQISAEQPKSIKNIVKLTSAGQEVTEPIKFAGITVGYKPVQQKVSMTEAEYKAYETKLAKSGIGKQLEVLKEVAPREGTIEALKGTTKFVSTGADVLGEYTKADIEQTGKKKIVASTVAPLGKLFTPKGTVAAATANIPLVNIYTVGGISRDILVPSAARAYTSDATKDNEYLKKNYVKIQSGIEVAERAGEKFAGERGFLYNIGYGTGVLREKIQPEQKKYVTQEVKKYFKSQGLTESDADKLTKATMEYRKSTSYGESVGELTNEVISELFGSFGMRAIRVGERALVTRSDKIKDVLGATAVIAGVGYQEATGSAKLQAETRRQGVLTEEELAKTGLYGAAVAGGTTALMRTGVAIDAKTKKGKVAAEALKKGPLYSTYVMDPLEFPGDVVAGVISDIAGIPTYRKMIFTKGSGTTTPTEEPGEKYINKIKPSKPSKTKTEIIKKGTFTMVEPEGKAKAVQPVELLKISPDIIGQTPTSIVPSRSFTPERSRKGTLTKTKTKTGVPSKVLTGALVGVPTDIKTQISTKLGVPTTVPTNVPTNIPTNIMSTVYTPSTYSLAFTPATAVPIYTGVPTRTIVPTDVASRVGTRTGTGGGLGGSLPGGARGRGGRGYYFGRTVVNPIKNLGMNFLATKNTKNILGTKKKFNIKKFI